ncbi:uncharacterized protein FRV6_10271 [Fusarium oxysporum]|uniref:Xylanolytic transcriptional activator regulatory domain-containing protein n=1 Tax=Fusarium oxysporum TaxID=5507 RepID=A0A2H3TBM8_FUSOX|nr:uncharacterized protein FRV6_10271 [Fusarium oxysporum]
MSDQDAAETLCRLRSGTDAASILSHVKKGHLLIQFSLSAETTRRYEFPYISGIPKHLLIEGNVCLNSLLYYATSPSSQGRKAIDSSSETGRCEPDGTSQHTNPADKIRTTPWTRVISDNELLKRLICSYFQYPHPCGPVVQKDLFLQDMAAGQNRFCTPLLFNAMLSIGCESALHVQDRSKMWLPGSLTYRFMAEARRLWDIELCKGSSIPTIQAAMIISYTTTNNRTDQVGALYLDQALEMGRDLDLFCDRDSADPDLDKARIFAAWALYSWQSLFNFSFFRLLSTRKPPLLPRPDPTLNPKWIKKKLDDWRSNLPEPLQPKNLVFPSNFALHVQYHQLVMSFMQVIMKSNHQRDPRVLEAC